MKFSERTGMFILVLLIFAAAFAAVVVFFTMVERQYWHSTIEVTLTAAAPTPLPSSTPKPTGTSVPVIEIGQADGLSGVIETISSRATELGLKILCAQEIGQLRRDGVVREVSGDCVMAVTAQQGSLLVEQLSGLLFEIPAHTPDGTTVPVWDINTAALARVAVNASAPLLGHLVVSSCWPEIVDRLAMPDRRSRDYSPACRAAVSAYRLRVWAEPLLSTLISAD